MPLTARRQTFFDLGIADKIAVVAFAHLIYGFHFLPEYGVHIAQQNPILLMPFIAVITAMVAFKDFLRQKAGRFFWFATGLYYSILTAYLVFVTYISLFPMDPWIPAVFFGWALPVFAWKKYRRLRLFFGLHLLALAPLFFWIDSRCPDRSPWVIVSYLLLAAFGYAILFRRRAFALFGAAPIVFFAYTSIAFPLLYARMQGIDTQSVPRITDQPGVSLLYSYESAAYEQLGNHYMFAAPLGDSIVLGPHDPNEYFYLFNPESLMGDKPQIERIHIRTRAGDMAQYDPRNPETIYVGGWRCLFQLSSGPFRILRRIELEGGLYNMLRVDAKKRFLFAAQDHGKRIARFDLDNPDEPVYSPFVDEGCVIFDVILDPGRNKYFMGATALDGWHIFQGDEYTLEIERRGFVPKAYAGVIEIDPETGLIYLTSGVTGELIIYDMEALKVVKRIPIGIGARNLTFDHKRRLLFASEFYNGYLRVFNVDESKTIGKIEVGPLVRHPQMGPHGDRLYVHTTSGVFLVNIDEAVRGLAKGQTGDAAE